MLRQVIRNNIHNGCAVFLVLFGGSAWFKVLSHYSFLTFRLAYAFVYDARTYDMDLTLMDILTIIITCKIIASCFRVLKHE